MPNKFKIDSGTYFRINTNVLYVFDGMHKGITSTAVCPGFTVTGFHTASGVQDEMDRVPSFMKLSATRVASEGIEATLSGKPL